MPEHSTPAIVNRQVRQIRSAGKTYALALVALLAAVVLRWLLDPLMGDALPLVTLFGAVAAAVGMGGVRPAVLVAILGYGACSYLFIEPRGSLRFHDVGGLVGLAAYLFTCALIIGVGEAARVSRGRASEQRELMRVTLRSIGDAVLTTDVAGRVTSINAVAERLTGWTAGDAVGQPLDRVFQIIDEDTRQPVPSPVKDVLQRGVGAGLPPHALLIRRDGRECPIEDSIAPIRNERGDVSGSVLTFRDVSAPRRTEQERASQFLTARLLASIIESSDDAIISKSLQGTIQSWNEGAERLFGWKAEQVIGRHISVVIPPERLAEEDRIIASLKAGKRIEHFETERVRADGARVHVSLTVSPIKDHTGAVVGASKIVRDITGRKRAEAEREKFVTLVENSTDFIGMCDLKGIPFFVNRAGLALVGLDDIDEARRVEVASFFFPEDQDRLMREFFPSVLEKGHGEIEVRFRHFKTGAARWMAYKVLTLPDAAGRPIAFATVSQDVTDRRRMEDDFRRLADDLSEADRRKNEFLAMLAHELRNPLAPISNAAQVLRASETRDEAIHSASAMLDRQVGHMSRLVDDLLDISRITRGNIELRKERVELGPIVAETVEAVRAIYCSLSHEVTVSLPPQPIYLDADPTRLAQVVGNLVNNACKFTDKGGKVSLTVEREGEQAVLRVRDNGIGIAADQIPRLFQMFAQVDSSRDRSRDGLGIGLTLVKTLVEMHGGTVEAHSEGLGRGSEFVVRLPILTGALAPLEPPAAGDQAPAIGRRILVVDDNEDGAESMALLLQFGGHETHTAHDGLEAIAAAERLRPDAVLLDIGLPKMNGYDVCRHIRQEPWGKRMVLIALTGWGQEEDRHRSQEAGFDAHLVKPVDFDALTKLLAAVPSAPLQAPPPH